MTVAGGGEYTGVGTITGVGASTIAVGTNVQDFKSFRVPCMSNVWSTN